MHVVSAPVALSNTSTSWLWFCQHLQTQRETVIYTFSILLVSFFL